MLKTKPGANFHATQFGIFLRLLCQTTEFPMIVEAIKAENEQRMHGAGKKIHPAANMLSVV
jgi:hypothetical protein